MFKPEQIMAEFHAEQLTQAEAEVWLCACTVGDLVDCPEALAMVRQIDGERYTRLSGVIAKILWEAGE